MEATLELTRRKLPHLYGTDARDLSTPQLGMIAALEALRMAFMAQLELDDVA